MSTGTAMGAAGTELPRKRREGRQGPRGRHDGQHDRGARLLVGRGSSLEQHAVSGVQGYFVSPAAALLREGVSLLGLPSLLRLPRCGLLRRAHFDLVALALPSCLPARALADPELADDAGAHALPENAHRRRHRGRRRCTATTAAGGTPHGTTRSALGGSVDRRDLDAD